MSAVVPPWPLPQPPSSSPDLAGRRGGGTSLCGGRVRRNLFGASQGQKDLDESRRFLEKELRRQRFEDADKWNFDFEGERPLCGRYQWEQPGLELQLPGERDREREQRQEKMVPVVQGQRDEEDGEGTTAQTMITDFMKKRKYSSAQQEKEISDVGSSSAKSFRRSST